MTQPWKDANISFPQSILSDRFWFTSWADFLNQSPYESAIWQMRGISLLSWSVAVHHELQTLQIVFLVKEPKVELMYFEFPVKNSDEEVVRQWLSERIPHFWKI